MFSTKLTSGSPKALSIISPTLIIFELLNSRAIMISVSIFMMKKDLLSLYNFKLCEYCVYTIFVNILFLNCHFDFWSS